MASIASKVVGEDHDEGMLPMADIATTARSSAPAGAEDVHAPPATSDGVLVRLATAGHAGALAVLFNRYRAAAYAVARQTVSRQADADDAVAEAFARVIEHLDTLRDPERFRAFLLSCVRNASHDSHRAATRMAGSGALETCAHPGRSVETLVESADSATRLVDALDRLPPRQRHALRRFYWDEASVTTIASELALTTNATTQLLFRAKAGLARCATDLGTPARIATRR